MIGCHADRILCIPVHLNGVIALQSALSAGGAQGNPKEYSDIDLAVISDWFEGKPKIENMQYLSRIAAAYNSLIEALPFTEEEYRDLDKRSFLASIIQSGRNSSELLEKLP